MLNTVLNELFYLLLFPKALKMLASGLSMLVHTCNLYFAGDRSRRVVSARLALTKML
jgi:hypothetical protein